jgi:VanZ family protein
MSRIRRVLRPRVVSLWLPVAVWAAFIFALSSLHGLDSGLGVWDDVLRKLGHVTEYAVLGALLERALWRPLPAFVLGAAYAASDELHQHFVPGRTGAPLDVAIDAVGVLIGIVAYRRLRSHAEPGERAA